MIYRARPPTLGSATVLWALLRKCRVLLSLLDSVRRQLFTSCYRVFNRGVGLGRPAPRSVTVPCALALSPLNCPVSLLATGLLSLPGRPTACREATAVSGHVGALAMVILTRLIPCWRILAALLLDLTTWPLMGPNLTSKSLYILLCMSRMALWVSRALESPVWTTSFALPWATLAIPLTSLLRLWSTPIACLLKL